MNIKKISIFLLAIVLVWSCGKDDDPPVPGVSIPAPTVDPADASSVSTEIGLDNPNWIEKTGTAPASNGAITQFSNSDNDTVPATNGRTVAIDIDLISGTAASIFFEIDGANAHYEVPADPDGRKGLIAKSGPGNRNPWGAHLVKKKGNMNRSAFDSLGYLFVFNIPSSIKPGMFCVRFALTNAAGDVSNYVTFCVQLTQRGGEGSSNLSSKPWKAEKWEDIYTDSAGNVIDIYTELYGVKEWDTVFYFLPCPGGGQQEVQVIEWYFYKLFLNFKTNGEFVFESHDEYQSLNWDLSDCTNVVYEGDSYDDIETGGWSYNSSAMTMTLSFDGYYDDSGYYNSPYSETFPVVSQSANKFVLRVYDEPGNEELITFIPR